MYPSESGAAPAAAWCSAAYRSSLEVGKLAIGVRSSSTTRLARTRGSDAATAAGTPPWPSGRQSRQSRHHSPAGARRGARPVHRRRGLAPHAPAACRRCPPHAPPVLLHTPLHLLHTPPPLLHTPPVLLHATPPLLHTPPPRRIRQPRPPYRTQMAGCPPPLN
eukprot:scaffold40261_cov197-Isochrysis_galbana.AAC.3